VSVCAGRRKKNRTKLAFQRERAIRPGGKNQFKQGKFFNSKVLKLWILLGKVPSHF